MNVPTNKNKNGRKEASLFKGSPPQVMPPNRPSKAEMAVRAIMFVALSWVVAVALKLLQHPLYDSVVHANSPVPLNAAYPYVSFLVTAFAVGVMTRLWDRRPLASLGLRLHKRTIAYLACGVALGSLLHIYAWVFINLLHGTFSVWVTQLSLQIATWGEALKIGAKFAIPAFYEELYFRSYVLQSLLQAWGSAPAVVSVSLAFSLAHKSQPPGYVIIFLSGVIYALAYLKLRSLWFPIGIHFGWNVSTNILQLNPIETLNPVIYYVAFYSVLSLAILILLLLPLRPHPRDQELWDRYVKPAPWPPWRRRRSKPKIQAAQVPADTDTHTHTDANELTSKP